MLAENALAEPLVRLAALGRSESDWQTKPDGALLLVLALELNVSLGRQAAGRQSGSCCRGQKKFFNHSIPHFFELLSYLIHRFLNHPYR